MSFTSLLINLCDIKRYSQASVVIGTDGNDYYCIKAHTSTNADKPITGANYLTYWKATGGTGVGAVWVVTTDYILSVDGYGNPVKIWAVYLPDEHCRWSTPNNREVKVGAEVVLADLQLFLGKDVDITEQDRVVLDSGATYEVLSAADRQNGADNHHVECFLRAVR